MPGSKIVAMQSGCPCRQDAPRKRGRIACRFEMADDLAFFGQASAAVSEDFLHLDDVAFHAGDFGNGGDFALTVGQAGQVER